MLESARAVTNDSFQLCFVTDNLAYNEKKEFMMLNVGITDERGAVPQLHATLWRCDRCNSFISIHSTHIVDEAFCPVCGDVPLELCGPFNSIPGLQFADA
jgi:hypothetical protein